MAEMGGVGQQDSAKLEQVRHLRSEDEHGQDHADIGTMPPLAHHTLDTSSLTGVCALLNHLSRWSAVPAAWSIKLRHCSLEF